MSKYTAKAAVDAPVEFETNIHGVLIVTAGGQPHTLKPDEAKRVAEQFAAWWGLFPCDESSLRIVPHGERYWTLDLNGKEINGYSNEQYAECAYTAVRNALQCLGLMPKESEETR